ncbi:hypothetical protein Trydic_g16828 [Trypoxylus dichotomus]
MSISEGELSNFATDQSEVNSDNADRQSGNELDELITRLSIININYTSNAMARPEITKHHIDLIPVYEGDPNTLSMYIAACEYLARTFGNVRDPTDNVNGFFLRIFQSKLTGRALQLVGSREVIDSWCNLKCLLQQNLCDQRSEHCLVQDLMQMRPEKWETVYNFGIRCKNIPNFVLAKVKLTENDANRRQIKTELHTVLQTYLREIAQFDIGHRVRFRNPENIETAMSHVLEEENFNYFAKQPNSINNIEFKPMKQQAPLHQNSFSTHKPAIQNIANTNRNQRQYQPIQQHFRQPMLSQTPFRNQPQTGPQWPQQAQWKPSAPQTHRASSFRFAKSPGQLEQRRQPRQTPMEVGTISGQVQKPKSFQFQSIGKPNWLSEELYYQTDDDATQIEEKQQDGYYYPREKTQNYEEDTEYDEYTNYEEQTNFTIQASTSNQRKLRRTDRDKFDETIRRCIDVPSGVIAPGVKIPASITNAKDFHAITEIANFNNYPVEIDIDKPICVEIYKPVNELNNIRIPFNAKQKAVVRSQHQHLLVPKKIDASGKIQHRMVIDYRKLNDQTIEDKYPIPNITDILDKLGRSRYFATLDLAAGYHQIEMDQKNIKKTAFSTEQGHYEYKRMPFGLKNAPATFQKMMDNVLRDALSRIKLNALETDSIINNVGDGTEELLRDIQEFLEEEIRDLGEVPLGAIDEIVDADEETDTAPEAEMEELRETAHSNENQEPIKSIPSMDEAIDNKNPQYHFRYTHLNKVQVEFNQNQGKKIYLVQVPKENNAEQLLQVMKEYMDTGKH